MAQSDLLVEQFEAHGAHLTAVASLMLGRSSTTDEPRLGEVGVR